MAAVASNVFANRGLLALFPFEAKWVHVALPPSVTYAAGTVLGEVQLSDIWSLATGAQSSGTFTLTFGGVTTAAIAYNDSAATIQTRLRALSTVGATGVTVVLASGTPGTNAVYTITFAGPLAYTANGNLTGTFTGLTTPGNASLTHTATGQSLGTYKAYADANTDGSGTARGILQYACATDSSGNISFSTVAGGNNWGQTSKSCPMFVEGTFQCSEITGLDAAAVTDLGRLIEGTLTSGILRMP